MRFTLKKEFRFEAAHKLPQHDGICQRLHGHSFKMRVEVADNLLHVNGPKSGMLQDFSDISRVVKPILEKYLDHHYLNETTGLSDPTSEQLAAWIFQMIKPELPKLTAIEIDETCTSFCRFEP